MASLLSGSGLATVIFLLLNSFYAERSDGYRVLADFQRAHSGSSVVRLLAVGDVNLGREVGQRILLGDTKFPFEFVNEEFKQYDVVFANLESTLSDQNGETQHPKNNLIFTGPPEGAWSLRDAGVTIVSTANNHALDYGVRSHRETIQYLEEADVAFVGTSRDSAMLNEPKVLVRNGIRMAFFACTDVMNMENPIWKRYVASADTSTLLPKIRAYRESVDFVIVSYHGGEEYADGPSRRTREFARALISNGADLFLGHHPHVPHGIEYLDGKYILYSLGNFVFRQPSLYWTQRSFAFAAEIKKDASGTRIVSFKCRPVNSGFQPAFVSDANDVTVILERVKTLSSKEVVGQIAW
ncbi:MAG: CapA family protein [Ignavibacteriae bacterium]|nr:CapA family protein [Ignavibacteriota bacterium]